MKTMNFLVNDMGVDPQEIARRPAILSHNLENTLIPRWAVVKILNSKGLIKSGLRKSSFMVISEKAFLLRYVTPFQNDLPFLFFSMNKVQKLD